MKVLELFAGTRSVSKAFEERGHQVLTVDWDPVHDGIDINKDVFELYADEITRKFGRPDVVWASPDCTTYSIAAISHHRKREANGNLAPVTEYAEFCDRVNMHVHNLIMMLTPPMVHREPTRRNAQDGFYARLETLHGYVLPVWRRTDEADRYLD